MAEALQAVCELSGVVINLLYFDLLSKLYKLCQNEGIAMFIRQDYHCDKMIFEMIHLTFEKSQCSSGSEIIIILYSFPSIS